MINYGETEKEMKQHRRENFAVEISNYYSEPFVIAVTFNGYQHTTLSVNKEELQKISNAIIEALK